MNVFEEKKRILSEWKQDKVLLEDIVNGSYDKRLDRLSNFDPEQAFIQELITVENELLDALSFESKYKQFNKRTSDEIIDNIYSHNYEKVKQAAPKTKELGLRMDDVIKSAILGFSKIFYEHSVNIKSLDDISCLKYERKRLDNAASLYSDLHKGIELAKNPACAHLADKKIQRYADFLDEIKPIREYLQTLLDKVNENEFRSKPVYVALKNRLDNIAADHRKTIKRFKPFLGGKIYTLDEEFLEINRAADDLDYIINNYTELDAMKKQLEQDIGHIRNYTDELKALNLDSNGIKKLKQLKKENFDSEKYASLEGKYFLKNMFKDLVEEYSQQTGLFQNELSKKLGELAEIKYKQKTEKEKQELQEKKDHDIKKLGLEKELKQIDLEKTRIDSSSRGPFNLPSYIGHMGVPDNQNLRSLRRIFLGDYKTNWKDRFKNLCNKLPQLDPVGCIYEIDYLCRFRQGIEAGLKRGTCAKEMRYTKESRKLGKKALELLDDYLKTSEQLVQIAA